MRRETRWPKRLAKFSLDIDLTAQQRFSSHPSTGLEETAHGARTLLFYATKV